jgi:circadian clock protein KaiC
VQVFPRVIVGPEEKSRPAGAGAGGKRRERLSVGVKGLDEMLGGGIPVGYSVLLTGPSGSGKSVLASEFISEGARHEEPGIIAVFEKRPPTTRRMVQVDSGSSGSFASARWASSTHDPLDLSIDEMLHEIVEAIHRLKARRLVIDSLSGSELALAPTFREDFRSRSIAWSPCSPGWASP